MSGGEKDYKKGVQGNENGKKANSTGNIETGGINKNTVKEEVKEAAALSYSPGNNRAPKLVAAGRGEIAKKIIETAENNDVPIYEDARLAQTLNRLQLGDEIPPELYEVVAEILVFVSNLDKTFGEKYGTANGKE